MIVPLKNAKTYGVLHSENYFSFLGFSKKVNSDEVQKVDVYLDDELIDTIIANKNLQKIEDIYDLEGFGFDYILPNEYIGKKNVISFKNHETKENLQNSPYKLITENHPEFNKMLFLNSLENLTIKIDYNEVLNTNYIGFLITKENMEDTVFTVLIQKLSKLFPNKILAYGFNNEDYISLQKLFPLNDNISFVILNNLNQIIENINIWIESSYMRKGKLFNFLLYDNENTLCFNIENILELTLKELNNLDRFKNHIFLKYPDFFNLKHTNNLFELLCNEINVIYNENMTYENYLIKHIEFHLANKKANKFYTQRVNKLRDIVNGKVQIK